MSDLVSNMTPSTMTEIALVIFVAVFVAISLRTLRRGAHVAGQEAAQLPLLDDTTGASEPGAAARSTTR
jgi:cbb3-type cytochrome oxidase subunit 3